MEIWKPVKDYEGIYEVSNLGRVKSLTRWVEYKNCVPRFKLGKLFKTNINSWGYLFVRLSKNGKSKTLRIHQLVAVAFLNHKPDGTHKLVVDHINDDKLDNRVENLQIVTQRENSHKTQGNYSSKYKGVHWSTRDNKWLSQIQINGKLKYLGLFKCELAASVAYQNKLKTL